MSLTFQNVLTVFGNIAFPLRVSGMERGRVAGAVEEAAGMLGISDLLSARPRELSGRRIPGRVETVESLGRERLVHARIQGQTLKVLSVDAADSGREGESVSVSFSFDAAHCFKRGQNG